MHAELIIILVLLALSAFFSSAETALTSLSRHQLHHLRQKKVKGIKSVIYLRENPGIMLATILIGNSLVNIAIASLVTLVILNYFHKLNINSELYVTPLSTFIATVIVLVFGEVTPKTIALSKTRRFALFSAPLVLGMAFLLRPIVFILNKFSNFCIRLLGGQPLENNSLVTEDEILALIEAGQESGSIAKTEKNMLHDVLKFGDTLVGEVMTALDNVISVPETASLAQVLTAIKDRVHSRIPVYSGTKNNIIGLLYLKDLIVKLNELKDLNVFILKNNPQLLRRPFIVYIDQKTSDILPRMRFHNVHIAIVQNRESKTVGLVTIEDMIEEIVGEIKDEYEK